MQPNDEQMSDEEYVESFNKLLLSVAQMGIDFDKDKLELVDFVMNICDDFVEDEDKEEISNSIFNKLFESQINIYLLGCSYFVNTFKEYCSKNKIEVHIVDVDEVNLNNEESQQDIIDSTVLFLQSISERFDNPNTLDDETNSFRAKISDVISLYLDTSFIMGLTDAKVLNYLRNKQESVHFGDLQLIMETIFPKVF